MALKVLLALVDSQCKESGDRLATLRDQVKNTRRQWESFIRTHCEGAECVAISARLGAAQEEQMRAIDAEVGPSPCGQLPNQQIQTAGNESDNRENEPGKAAEGHKVDEGAASMRTILARARDGRELQEVDYPVARAEQHEVPVCLARKSAQHQHLLGIRWVDVALHRSKGLRLWLWVRHVEKEPDERAETRGVEASAHFQPEWSDGSQVGDKGCPVEPVEHNLLAHGWVDRAGHREEAALACQRCGKANDLELARAKRKLGVLPFHCRRSSPQLPSSSKKSVTARNQQLVGRPGSLRPATGESSPADSGHLHAQTSAV